MSQIDWPGALVGALLTLVLAVPTAVIVRALGHNQVDWQESNVWVVGVVVILVAFAIGGAVAARRGHHGPLATAAASGAMAFAPLVVIDVVRRVAQGRVPPVPTLLVYWMVFVSVSLLGGLLVSRVRAHRERLS